MNNLQKPVSIETLLDFPYINDLKFSRGGRCLLWVESIDGNGGLFTESSDRKIRLISADFDVAGGIGYGGGEFDAGHTIAVFAEKSGGLIKTNINEPLNPVRITPAWGRNASPVLSPDEKWVLFVYNDGKSDGIAITGTTGHIWPVQIVLGSDFYMQPVWHPNGELIAWSEWDHPSMPWDASRIKTAEVEGMQLRLLEESWIAGEKGHAASQPQFSPDGKWLSYIEKKGNWDNLYLFNLDSRKRVEILKGNEYHLKLPEWVQGMRSYNWSSDSRTIYHFRFKRGQTTLWRTNIGQKKSVQISIKPVTWAAQISVSTESETIAFLGSSPSMPKQICVRSDKSGKMEFRMHNKFPALPEIELQEMKFGSNVHEQAYGLYIPPLRKSSKSGRKPALFLHVHSGPTSLSAHSFSRDLHYFTSRGFAYSLLNYRGSAGFGYQYQDALFHRWGIVDVEDAAAFARHLIAEGLADPDKMVIMGASAGGFTVLNTLIQYPGLFRAGICSYGVTDLIEDARNTHKFEKYYHTFLTGDLEKDYQQFIDRSPINHIDKIKDPIALFHGRKDKVVDISQSVRIYEQLRKKGIPCMLQIYEDEGHGFRKTENIKDFYKKIEHFLSLYL